ncbi:MAG: single-stranded DNA-binding protein, partial [Deltaproteobacteria bacterium]|nr:single-stranded DNA-binding protein [Deltaproteobacteria bacterium]
TEWHHIVVWGKSAENCGQFLRKGRQVYVEGAIRSRSYDTRDGTKRSITEIITQRVQFLGGPGGGGGGAGGGGGGRAPSSGGGGGGGGGSFDEFGGGPIPEDDVPF